MRRPIPLLLAAMSIVLPVIAHDGASAHEVAKGPHGGRVAEGGGVHVELVAKQMSLEVYLTDAKDQAVAPTGYKGTAILMIDGKALRIPLAPDNARLVGNAPNPIPAEPKGVVQVTAPDGKTGQARFN